MNAEKRSFGLTGEQKSALHTVLVWTKKYFDNMPDYIHIGGHGFDKTMRQAGMAALIAQKEGCPVFLPVLTAAVMDVGRAVVDERSTNFRHGELSREMIEKALLPNVPLLTNADKTLIGNAVEDHSKLNDKVRRNYVVEVVMDADRLDCLGALGPLRAASWRPNIPIILPAESTKGSGDTEIQTMYQDMSVRHIEWFDMLWTESAKRIAIPRVRAYRNYLKRLKRETSYSYQAFEALKLGVSYEEFYLRLPDDLLD